MSVYPDLMVLYDWVVLCLLRDIKYSLLFDISLELIKIIYSKDTKYWVIKLLSIGTGIELVMPSNTFTT